MSIQVLPPQLANQIAAGEVVERPASVVKELVENSLDAGATRIDIEIERGGAKMLRIRDNGVGIAHDDLALALARHATSKISSLDDLEAIISLGFRGEALASISAVSRLTLTSRTTTQQEAWQAYAEGRDMAVTVKPAAHPVGTTVEVLDLFYNTPARRKFMRTEKTEFAHIDEIVRRIALACFDIDIQLHHNGKKVRQYRAATENEQKARRLGTICGSSFLQNALVLQWVHDDLAIDGWVVAPSGLTSSDMQYFYVNGRMIRDKLITHAIRQAYQGYLNKDQQLAYVLYLQLDPHQVDVNVHPAKHEVRFHQARLVHDFIYQTVLSVLQQMATPTSFPTSVTESSGVPGKPETRVSAGVNQFNQSTTAREPSSSYSPMRRIPANVAYPIAKGYQKRDGELYQRLMKVSPKTISQLPLKGDIGGGQEAGFVSSHEKTVLPTAAMLPHYDAGSFGRVLMIYGTYLAIIESRGGMALLDLNQAASFLLQAQLTPIEAKLRAQPLLIPIKLSLNEQELQAMQCCSEVLHKLGIELEKEGHQARLSAVPAPMRQQNLPDLIPALLTYLATTPNVEIEQIAYWLACHLTRERQQWSAAQAIQLLADLERLCPLLVQTPPAMLLQPIDLQPALQILQAADKQS